MGSAAAGGLPASTAHDIAAPSTDAVAWFDDWMREGALPFWWEVGADHERGGFHERIDLDGRPTAEPRRLRVQARQAFVFARAGRAGWRGPWREAAAHGLDYIERRYAMPGGLYRGLCDESGDGLDDVATTYDQAFVLLAFAEAAACGLAGADWARRADRLRDALEPRRNDRGVYREVRGQRFQSNANMHLFEAALAWTALDPASWGGFADAIGEAALGWRERSPRGSMPEVLDEAWEPARGEAGRMFEPGHQFEWAWLLDHWSSLGRGRGPNDRFTRRLFDNGVRGVDPTRGVAVNALRDDGMVLDGNARLWPQTEWLRAARRFGAPGQTDAAMGALRRYLIPDPPLWRDHLSPEGDFVVEAAPASSLYHLASAWSDLVRPRA